MLLECAVDRLALSHAASTAVQVFGRCSSEHGPGRPVKSGTPSPIVAPKRRIKRAKRTPEDVAKMGEAVVAYVAKNPGQSVEQIKKALGVETQDLQLPIVRMVAANRLKTTGQRRGTRYRTNGPTAKAGSTRKA